MKLRKFFGLTSRAVLHQVRTELGPDAMIVANRPVADGIEITAMPGDAMSAMLADGGSDGADAGDGGGRDTPVPRSEPERWAPPRVDPGEVTWPVRIDAPAPVMPAAAAAAAAAADAPQAAAARRRPAGPAPDEPRAGVAPEVGSRLMEEVAALRGMLEGQLAQLAWNDTQRRQPLRARFTRDLLVSGYSAALAREITARLPDDFTPGQALTWVAGIIAKNLRCAAADDDLVVRGGVYALVGPTGVGKTTTVAKLAARGAVRYGSAGLALLTTDSYRVGAHDQLRIYAKILGVPVHTVSATEDLAQALDSLRAKHLVLIDTVGMGQRDTRVPEQATLLAHPLVRRVLVLNATAQAETLEEVVAAYGAAVPEAGRTRATAIVTKLDETARPGQVLDVAIRHRLTLQYVSNGQRVPEDLHPANAAYLVDRSLKTAPAPMSSSPFALQSDEFGMLLGAAGVAHA